MTLFFSGIELAVGINGDSCSRSERTILLVTAGVALWHRGVAYPAGLMLHRATQRGILPL